MSRSHNMFIPKEVWELDLSTDARVLLADMIYWWYRKGFCETSNIQFADELNCSQSKISTLLKGLQKEKYIHVKTKISCPPPWRNNDQPTTSRQIFLNEKKDIKLTEYLMTMGVSEI